MAQMLILRLDAPLMSFGGVQIDGNGVTMPFPGLSLLTGLIGNALGARHSEAESLQALQARVRHAAREDRAGQYLEDFQTVDLGQPFMASGWTSRGRPEGRLGGSASTGTAIRQRAYVADARYTLAVCLLDASSEPTLATCSAAIERPARPLFIGRKSCLPAAPLVAGFVDADTLREALTLAPWPTDLGAVPITSLRAWWPRESPGESEDPGERIIHVSDQRDWANQVHTGRRSIVEGRVVLAGETERNSRGND